MSIRTAPSPFPLLIGLLAASLGLAGCSATAPATVATAPTAGADIGPAPAFVRDDLAMGKMWTFENPPLAYLEREYGFKPDQKWFDSLRLSALRLGERDNPWCSASFVSPAGLVMTNHHCVRDKISESQGDKDWVKDGYVASALEDEYRLPGLTVQQLISQSDITAQVNEGVREGDDDAAVTEQREANKKQVMEAAEAAHPDQIHQVVTLFQGALHQLYSYRVYDDVRLVLAPHLQTAYFGGDPDNFTYPRWSIDFAFVRAYQDDKPADTSQHYFRWRQDGVREGELVFVPGNPGSTDRLITDAQRQSMRDAEYPITVEMLGNGIRILRHFAGQDPQIEKSLLPTILGWENSFKAFTGMLKGLRDEKTMRQQLDKERAFRATIDADPALKARFGKVWDRLAVIAADKRALHPRTVFHQASYSTVIERGLQIAKAVDASLTEEERAEARTTALNMRMGGNPITMSLLVDHFLRARNWLPAHDPYLQAVLGDGDVPAAMERLSGSQLADASKVEELLDGGAEAVAASTDVGMMIGGVLWPLVRENEQQEERLQISEKAQGTLMGLALHAVYGTRVCPDATMTLRFSDGVVSGYPCNGTVAPWATSLYGLYARVSEFDNQYPFEVPQAWLDAEDKVDMSKKVCFASTNDIIGGNSGSAVVDRDLRVVGLIFDGNIESLPNNFWFLQDTARAVSVHTDSIMEATTKVYSGQRIAEELLGGGSDNGR